MAERPKSHVTDSKQPQPGANIKIDPATIEPPPVTHPPAPTPTPKK